METIEPSIEQQILPQQEQGLHEELKERLKERRAEKERAEPVGEQGGAGIIAATRQGSGGRHVAIYAPRGRHGFDLDQKCKTPAERAGVCRKS